MVVSTCADPTAEGLVEIKTRDGSSERTVIGNWVVLDVVVNFICKSLPMNEGTVADTVAGLTKTLRSLRIEGVANPFGWVRLRTAVPGAPALNWTADADWANVPALEFEEETAG
jgi:hypothetical protein